MTSKKAMFVFFVILLGILLLNLAINVRSYRIEQTTSDWLAVTGQILEKKVEQYQFGKTHYRAHIKYQYQVKSRSLPAPFKDTFTSDQIYASENKGYQNPDVARQILEKFPRGEVIVYYNPDDPSQSVLIKSTRSGTMKIIIISALLSLVCIGLLTWIKIKYKKNLLKRRIDGYR
jgi:hypothetical protein